MCSSTAASCNTFLACSKIFSPNGVGTIGCFERSKIKISKLFFELLNLHTQSWLGNKTSLGSTREMAVVVNSYDVTELSNSQTYGG